MISPISVLFFRVFCVFRGNTFPLFPYKLRADPGISVNFD